MSKQPFTPPEVAEKLSGYIQRAARIFDETVGKRAAKILKKKEREDGLASIIKRIKKRNQQTKDPTDSQ